MFLIFVTSPLLLVPPGRRFEAELERKKQHFRGSSADDTLILSFDLISMIPPCRLLSSQLSDVEYPEHI